MFRVNLLLAYEIKISFDWQYVSLVGPILIVLLMVFLALSNFNRTGRCRLYPSPPPFHRGLVAVDLPLLCSGLHTWILVSRGTSA